MTFDDLESFEGHFDPVQLMGIYYELYLVFRRFLADRTNGRAIGTVLRTSVCRLSSSSVTLCIVAKRCVLEQKLLSRAYRKSYMRNRLVPK